jgi:MFS family permease
VGWGAARGRLRAFTALPREVVVLGLIAFCVAVGFGVLIPVLPIFARSFGVGHAAVGAVISAFALLRLVSSPLSGRLIGRVGERTVLVTGILVVAVSSGLAGAARSYVQLLVLRGVGGVGSAMFTVSAMTLLLTSVGPELRGRAAGFFQAGFLLGGMTGPAVGGVLAAISLTAPFFFYAATLAVAGLVGAALLRPQTHAVRGAREADTQPLRLVVQNPGYQAACATNFASGWTSFGVRTTLVPLLVAEVLHRPTSWTGLAFACAAIAQTLAVGPAGSFVDGVGRRPAMVGGGVLGALSILAVPFAPNLGLLIVALCMYGVAAAFLSTAPAAAVGDASGGGNGTAVALFSMCSDLGAIAGPLVAGVLVDRLSYQAAFALGAVLALLAAGNALRMPRTGPGGTKMIREESNPRREPVGEPEASG